MVGVTTTLSVKGTNYQNNLLLSSSCSVAASIGAVVVMAPASSIHVGIVVVLKKGGKSPSTSLHLFSPS